METVEDKVVNKLVETKVSSYGGYNSNFVIPTEITVTITLKEYRDLVEAKATAEFVRKEINSELSEAKCQIQELKNTIKVLHEANSLINDGDDMEE
jgi:ribosomal protein L9